jgi:hypothetical protein
LTIGIITLYKNEVTWGYNLPINEYIYYKYDIRQDNVTEDFTVGVAPWRGDVAIFIDSEVLPTREVNKWRSEWSHGVLIPKEDLQRYRRENKLDQLFIAVMGTTQVRAFFDILIYSSKSSIMLSPGTI